MQRTVLTLTLVSLLSLAACTAESRVGTVREKASRGDARAEALMGEMYANGTDVPQDYGQAAVWWTKSAADGYPQAEYNLGVLYEHGQGVARSDARAAEWYGRAARQGLAAAQYNMGVFYEHGRGVQQNLPEAVAWYRKAGEQGNADAQFNLGALYARQGQAAEAYYWLSLAAKIGDHDAERMRDKMAGQLAPAQADDVRRRVNTFRAVVVTG